MKARDAESDASPTAPAVAPEDLVELVKWEAIESTLILSNQVFAAVGFVLDIHMYVC